MSGNKSSSLSKGNKALDEANMKTLRDLSQIQSNRHCFDCGQRGPTYVDVTIGSFVCMTCSGLLRGLTPPHRVKSISMATFTSDEIQLLKSRGNEYCRKVWLATHTSRDSLLASESDPDRRSSLKSLMSAKYEQKRYWIDPSKLPAGELSEIQSQTLRALSSSSSSISNSNSSSGQSSTMQKSPSLSSASSGSSLSLQHGIAGQGSHPSPILNNLRNGFPGPSSSTGGGANGRLVNSVTLPDIKPLTGLLGSATTNGHPINFINNLSDDKIINTNPQNQNHHQNQKDPWGSATTNGDGGANFANFDEAFNGGGGGFGADLFSSQNQGQQVEKTFKNDSSTTSTKGFADFDSIQKPLLPLTNNANSNHNNNNVNHNSIPIQPSGGGGGGGGMDRYAALKDLDELFKHNGDSASPNSINHSSNGQQQHGHSNGLPNSTSLPVNLSTGGGGGQGLPSWFQSPSNNPPNPFSQVVGSSPPSSNGNGWTLNNQQNGIPSTNPHNPFFSTQGNGAGNGNYPNFGQQPSQHNGMNNFSFPQQMHQPFQTKAIFNPFSSNGSAATAAYTGGNPHNPFL